MGSLMVRRLDGDWGQDWDWDLGVKGIRGGTPYSHLELTPLKTLPRR